MAVLEDVSAGSVPIGSFLIYAGSYNRVTAVASLGCTGMVRIHFDDKKTPFLDTRADRTVVILSLRKPG